MENIEKALAYFDAHTQDYIERLREAVAIKSVSADPALRPEVVRMMDYACTWITKLGGTFEKVDPGTQTFPDGSVVGLPPIVLGAFGADPKKKTVCVYGHLDVQPANKDDGWDADPFVLTQAPNGALYGRGSTDDKGPVLSWFWVIEAFKELGLELPVNIKMVLEGMEESGSEGLDAVVIDQAKEGKFLSNVDYICISDNYWLGQSKPCLTYGLRGLVYFHVEIEGSTKDLHSGLFGGTIHEPTIEIMKVFSTLVDTKGNILIPGVNDSVAPLTPEEAARYEPIEFSVDQYKKDTGVVGDVIYKEKKDILMHRWRYPSLSIHGIQGAFSDAGSKTVIPRKVIGKFSIRLVPHQEPTEIFAHAKKHIEAEFAKLASPNKLTVHDAHGGKPWLSDVNHPNYQAGARAVKKVFGVDPDLTREGGSIPVTLTFEQATGKNVLLLPIGRSDDGAHSAGEKLDLSNYMQGIKVLARYLDEISKN